MKNRYISLLKRNVNRSGVDKLVSWLEKCSDFETAPASSRFHGSYPGGWLKHSLNVYDRLNFLLEADDNNDYSESTITLVALCHDLCKLNLYQSEPKWAKDANGKWFQDGMKYTCDCKSPLGEHGDLSVIMLQNFMQLFSEEIMAIRWHMGPSEQARNMAAAYEKCPLAVYLHMADMMATYIDEADHGSNA